MTNDQQTRLETAVKTLRELRYELNSTGWRSDVAESECIQNAILEVEDMIEGPQTL